MANNVEKFGDEYFDNFDSTMFRLTLIANDGVVLYDSQTDATLMENHLDREEVVEAIDTGNGSSARHSETLGRKTYYEAKLLKNGNVIRISVDQITLGALILGCYHLFSIILVALILAFILANKMSESIVKPLNELDVENLLEGETYDELSPMVNKIIKQQDKITRQMQELNQKLMSLNRLLNL